MTHSDVDRLQCPDACRALSEVGVRVHKDFQRPVQTDQQVCKVPVNRSALQSNSVEINQGSASELQPCYQMALLLQGGESRWHPKLE